MLALVGDAKEGLSGNVFPASRRRTGMRLGVAGTSMEMDVVGDVLRRFEGDSSIRISRIDYRLHIF